ncbi:MAG: thioredoxin family protein [Chloroflexi bacterium]|nr:thioredoxin family protein [Chloroflexota bacterium]
MRKVEVFSAGCILCDDAVKMVQDLACPDCEVTVHDLHTQEGLRQAGEYGVTRAPTVVIEGVAAPCCVASSPDEEQLQGSGVGVPRE